MGNPLRYVDPSGHTALVVDTITKTQPIWQPWVDKGAVYLQQGWTYVQNAVYTYGPQVVNAISNGGQKVLEFIDNSVNGSSGGGNFDPNDPRWKDIFGKSAEHFDEKKAEERLKKLEKSIKNSHFFKRHGAQTTLEQQLTRARSGLTPDGVQKGMADSSRFLSNKDQLSAIGQALERYTGKGEVTFDMGRVIGNGYFAGTEIYGETTQVMAYFNQYGEIVSIFPKLR